MEHAPDGTKQAVRPGWPGILVALQCHVSLLPGSLICPPSQIHLHLIWDCDACWDSTLFAYLNKIQGTIPYLLKVNRGKCPFLLQTILGGRALFLFCGQLSDPLLMVTSPCRVAHITCVCLFSVLQRSCSHWYSINMMLQLWIPIPQGQGPGTEAKMLWLTSAILISSFWGQWTAHP